MDAFVDEDEMLVGSAVIPEVTSNLENLNLKEEQQKVAKKREKNTKIGYEFERNERVATVVEETLAKSQTLPKYNYKKGVEIFSDQWSPLNLEGKRQYDRSYLLQMQSQPVSLRKPADFPDIEINKDTPKKPKSSKNRPANLSRLPRNIENISDFTHGYVKSSSNLRNVNKCPSQQKKIEQNGKKSILSINQEIGNKLTRQKIQALVDQIRSLTINTEECLKEVVDLVFEKALDDTNFSVAYASLCKSVAMIRVPKSNTEGSVNFRTLLLNKCQKEFEKDITDELHRATKIKEISEGAEKKREMEEELEELERRAKRRSVANIRLIGDLFKLNMLTVSIMHICLKNLITREDENSLECLCQLLTTIGKDFDTEKGKSSNKPENDRINCYFRQMQEIVGKRQVSSRVCFMLQDVIELRFNNWVPRREENDIKTSDQIHLEAEKDSDVARVFNSYAPGGVPSLAAKEKNFWQWFED